jgi:hypothetical protein
MVISKTYSTIAAIWLLGLAAGSQVWAQENGGELDSFNRSLGLEGMGTDLANAENELAHSNTPSAPEAPKKAGPGPKKAPVKREESFSNLSFHPSPAVTNSVRAYYVSRTNSAAFAGMPSYDALVSRFDERFSNYGFSRHNIGDTVAGYLIISWEILHNANASNTPKGIRRVREAISQVIERRGKAANLSDENKQKFSELFKSLAELVSEQSKQFRQANNQAAEAQLMNQVAQPPLKLGIDLRKLRLTDQGFVNG